MKIHCPECNAEYDVPVDTIGKMMQCQCGKSFQAELVPVARQKYQPQPSITPTQITSTGTAALQASIQPSAYRAPVVSSYFYAIGILCIVSAGVCFLSGIVAGIKLYMTVSEDLPFDFWTACSVFGVGGLAFWMSSIGSLLLSAPFFAAYHIINSLAKIAYNTDILVAQKGI